jgi:hypothetical protein
MKEERKWRVFGLPVGLLGFVSAFSSFILLLDMFLCIDVEYVLFRPKWVTGNVQKEKWF